VSEREQARPPVLPVSALGLLTPGESAFATWLIVIAMINIWVQAVAPGHRAEDCCA
jgi:hypothetical protein